jgi:hypothetical protein
MLNDMGLGYLFVRPIHTFMKANLRTVKRMDMAELFILLGVITLDFGNLIKNMAKEHTSFLMALFIKKEPGRKESS